MYIHCIVFNFFYIWNFKYTKKKKCLWAIHILYHKGLGTSFHSCRQPTFYTLLSVKDDIVDS